MGQGSYLIPVLTFLDYSHIQSELYKKATQTSGF